MNSFVIQEIKASIEVKQAILADAALLGLIQQIAEQAVRVYRAGHKLLLAGNGGSAADAQHIAGELVNRFRFDRAALPAVALSTDTSVLTAIGNDSGFDQVFARQVEALGVSGDMFIGISTSGKSVNIIRALEVCAAKGIIRVGFTGQGGGEMARLCDYCLAMPSRETPRVQEAHIMIAHIFCALVEETLFGKGSAT
ncbi:MAG: D-sedoheptulose 7-phosphate isomerase [Lentisphaerae bacterium]|nr:D-sedoheptulose 7-phosphate isomerase [Lentisphaerota bacterium]